MVKSFEYIHSVDSFALAERISRISGEEKRTPRTMLQVKFLEDPAKKGFASGVIITVIGQPPLPVNFCVINIYITITFN